MEAIVYTSKCGHSLVYAKALSQELNVPYYTIKEAKKILPKGSHILYMSWVRENKIVKYNKVLRYHIECVVAVGIMPASLERIGMVKEYNQIYAKLYYLPGGIRKKRLGLRNRIILHSIESEMSFKLLDSGLKKEEAYALDAVLHNLDYTNLNTLKPIIKRYSSKKDNFS